MICLACKKKRKGGYPPPGICNKCWEIFDATIASQLGRPTALFDFITERRAILLNAGNAR